MIKRTALDALFSDYIRHRDGLKCQVCGRDYSNAETSDRRGLHCAHCFSRGTKLTRWNPDNAVAACYWCHVGPRNETALDRNLHFKTKFFKAHLGSKRYLMLEWMHKNPGKFPKPDQAAIKLWLKSELKKYQGEILGAH